MSTLPAEAMQRIEESGPLTAEQGAMRVTPAMITFTSRTGVAMVPVFRGEDELLAQGALTVLALSRDRGDVILNPYPCTGPAGLSLGSRRS